jgi:hypothetical protein
MAEQRTSPRGSAPQEIPQQDWIAFLAAFTRENRGAHAQIEILGGDIGHAVETQDRPFDGISADVKDREQTVWITLGSTPQDRIAHGVHGARAIRSGGPAPGAGATLEIEAQDGTRTVLTLSRPEEYALPPGSHR